MYREQTGIRRCHTSWVRESRSRRRSIRLFAATWLQDLANLALLAPDVIDGIAVGEQPDGLTTDYLIKARFPAVWSEQREQFAAL